MNDKDVRKWYHEHGMEYIPEDWGQRLPNGESGGSQTVDQQRLGAGGQRIGNYTFAGEMERLLWGGHRDSEDADLMWALEDFFAPYITLLSRAKGELIRQVMNDQHTFDAVAEDLDMYGRNSAHRAFQRALRSLILLIAQDDPGYSLPRGDGRARDYKAELEAAEHVFDRYMTARNS